MARHRAQTFFHLEPRISQEKIRRRNRGDRKTERVFPLFPRCRFFACRGHSVLWCLEGEKREDSFWTLHGGYTLGQSHPVFLSIVMHSVVPILQCLFKLLSFQIKEPGQVKIFLVNRKYASKSSICKTNSNKDGEPLFPPEASSSPT